MEIQLYFPLGFLTLVSYAPEIPPTLDHGIILIHLTQYIIFFSIIFVLKSLSCCCFIALESCVLNMNTLQEVKSFLPLPLSSIEHDIMPSGAFLHLFCSVRQLDELFKHASDASSCLATHRNAFGSCLETTIWNQCRAQPQTPHIFRQVVSAAFIQNDCYQMLNSIFSDLFSFY